MQQIFFRTVKVEKEDMHVKYLAAIFSLSRVAFSEWRRSQTNICGTHL